MEMGQVLKGSGKEMESLWCIVENKLIWKMRSGFWHTWETYAFDNYTFIVKPIHPVLNFLAWLSCHLKALKKSDNWVLPSLKFYKIRGNEIGILKQETKNDGL